MTLKGPMARAAGLFALLALLGAESARAIPLDKETCANLALEKQGLQSLKVEDMMAKGPDWASLNLSQGDLNLIRRYIEVDEQIKFRCTPAKMLVKLRGLEEEEGGEGIGSGEDDADAGSDATAAAGVNMPPMPQKK